MFGGTNTATSASVVPGPHASADELAAWAATLTPAVLVASGTLALIEVHRLSHAGRIDYLAAVERQRGWLEAQQHSVLAAICTDANPHADDLMARERTPDGQTYADFWVAEEVSAALRLAPPTASQRLHESAELCLRFPRTVHRLRDGRISGYQARTLVQLAHDPLATLDPEIAALKAAAIEDRVLARADAQTAGQFRQAVRRAVLRLVPQDAVKRHEHEAKQRRVVITPADYGMAHVYAYVRAEEAATLWTALNTLAGTPTSMR